MATSLNKTRMRDSRLLIIGLILLNLFTVSFMPDETFAHESVEMIGGFLVAICAVGRVYSTAFLGGYKNESLITVGPYSMVRNPLYTFSMIGVAGVGLMSTHMIATIVLLLSFLGMYHRLIAREEQFLEEKFGDSFRDYKRRVPRLIPSFVNYTCPDELSFQPRFLNKAVFDALWWFVPYPVFEAIEYFHEADIITPILAIP